MIFDGDIYWCTVQSRLDKDIFYFKRVADNEFHRLPYTGRVITIESMRDVCQYGFVGLLVVLVILYFLAYWWIVVFHGVTGLCGFSVDVTCHFYCDQVASRTQESGGIYLEITEHTDVGTSRFAINIHFRHFGYGVEWKSQLFSLHVGGQFQPLAIPGSTGFPVVERIVLASVGFLLVVGVRYPFMLGTGGRWHGFSMQPDTDRVPESGNRHYMPVVVVSLHGDSLRLIVQLVVGHEQPVSVQR